MMTDSLIPAGVEMRFGGRSDSFERERGLPLAMGVAIVSGYSRRFRRARRKYV
jgi:hypothetical protein